VTPRLSLRWYIPTALRTPTAVHVVTPSLSWKELINALLFCRFFLTKKPGCTLQKFISFLPISLYLHCALHDRSSQNNICCTLNLREKSINEQFTGKESHKALSK